MAYPKRDQAGELRAMLSDIARKNLRTMRDLADGGVAEPDPKWSKRKQKVWRDAQMSTADAPVYLKAAMNVASDVFRAESNRAERVTLGVIAMPVVVSMEEWAKQAALVDQETEVERRKLLDAVVVEKKPDVG